jgi:hypothetical protein
VRAQLLALDRRPSCEVRIGAPCRPLLTNGLARQRQRQAARCWLSAQHANVASGGVSPSPGADVAGGDQSWRGCGRGEPSPGADVAAVRPVPAQMLQRRAQSRRRCGTAPCKSRARRALHCVEVT